MIQPMASQNYFERVMFRLSAVGARTELRFRELLAPLGLIPQSFAVLHRIAAADGITQQAVADLTGMRRSVMVTLLDELEELGLVERRRHPDDRRANALHLTPEGRRVLCRAEAAADQLDGEIAQSLSREERGAFAAALEAVDSSFGADGGVHPDTTLLPSRPPQPQSGSAD